MSRKISTNISFDEEIWFSEEFRKLKDQRKLSETINNLLRFQLAIKKADDLPDDDAKLEDELRMINIKKALLMEKQQEVRKNKEEYTQTKLEAIERIPRGNDFHSKFQRETYFKENPEHYEEYKKKFGGSLKNAEKTEKVKKSD